MIEDAFVIDAVVHAYDLSDENMQANRFAQLTRQAILGAVGGLMGEDRVVPVEVACTDWPIETVTASLFRESATDMAANHRLTLTSWFRDGLCSREKNIEAMQRWPQRYFSYVGVDPTQGVDECIADMRAQVAELPAVVGLKLYPHQVYPFRSWRMDDPAVAFPLFEAAQELGIKTVAIHKAVPLGPVPMDPYRVGDVDAAAMEFPELSFEIIHSGVAFVEETAHQLARFPNVFANLEITTMYLATRQRLFGELMGEFLMWGGPEKILWSTGVPSMIHTQWLLERFWEYELPEDVAQRCGVQLTREAKKQILGENFARMVGADISELKERTSQDEFAAVQSVAREPWTSNWKRIAPGVWA